MGGKGLSLRAYFVRRYPTGTPRNIAGLELFIGGRKRALKWPASHRPL